MSEARIPTLTVKPCAKHSGSSRSLGPIENAPINHRFGSFWSCVDVEMRRQVQLELK